MGWGIVAGGFAKGIMDFSNMEDQAERTDIYGKTAQSQRDTEDVRRDGLKLQNKQSQIDFDNSEAIRNKFRVGLPDAPPGYANDLKDWTVSPSSAGYANGGLVPRYADGGSVAGGIAAGLQAGADLMDRRKSTEIEGENSQSRRDSEAVVRDSAKLDLAKAKTAAANDQAIADNQRNPAPVSAAGLAPVPVAAPDVDAVTSTPVSGAGLVNGTQNAAAAPVPPPRLPNNPTGAAGLVPIISAPPATVTSPVPQSAPLTGARLQDAPATVAASATGAAPTRDPMEGYIALSDRYDQVSKFAASRGDLKNAGMYAGMALAAREKIRQDAGEKAYQAWVSTGGSDLQPLLNYYSKFVPDGNSVQGWSRDEKGNVTLFHDVARTQPMATLDPNAQQRYAQMVRDQKAMGDLDANLTISNLKKLVPQARDPSQARQQDAQAGHMEETGGREAARERGLKQRFDTQQRSADRRDQQQDATTVARYLGVLQDVRDDNKNIDQERKAIASDLSMTDDQKKTRLIVLNQRQQNNLAQARQARAMLAGDAGGGQSVAQTAKAVFLSQEGVTVDTPPQEGATLDDKGFWRVGRQYVADDNGRPLKGRPKATQTQQPAATATPVSDSPPVVPMFQADPALRDAETKLQQAESEVNRYSLSTRKRDPQGYRRALDARQSAEVVRDKAKAVYDRSNSDLDDTARNAKARRIGAPRGPTDAAYGDPRMRPIGQ